MSNPYPWIKDSQYLIPSVTGYLAVTSPNGLYMVDPTNSSHYTSFGIDTLNLNGTSYNWSTIVAGSATPTLSQVLGANNSAGAYSINMNNQDISSIKEASAQTAVLTNTTANTTLSVNTGSATSTPLLVKFNNGRTGQNGEAITLNFNAQNTNGVEINYAKIHMDVIESAFFDERGSLNFDVINNGASGLTTYFNCNGNTQEVNSFKQLNMNNNSIVGINSAITANINLLAPQKVDMLTATGVVPSTNLDSNMRYIACNTGAVPTWIDSGIANFGTAPGVVENVRASVTSFANAWWVGTESGNLWYSVDGGVSWTLQHSFGGFINCLSVYNNGTKMAVGGNFTAIIGNDYHNIAGVDTGFNMFDITPGYKGVNAEVKCFFNNTFQKCLYIGGRFTDFNGGSGGSYNTYAFFTFDYNTSTWYNALNHYGGGYVDNGGGVGVVNAISRDIATGYILVGGDFIQVYTNSGTQGIPYLFIYQTSNGHDASGFYPYGATGFNAPVNALLDYNGSGTLVGGDFSGIGAFLYSYGILIVWNGSTNQWDISPYPFAGSGGFSISSITQPQGFSTPIYTIWGEIYIYQNSTALPVIPVGTVWSCIAWDGTSILYATNAQTSATFNFYILSAAAAINLTSVYPIKQYSTISYNNITLLAEGSTIELIWNGTKSEWYILSYQGASFS